MYGQYIGLRGISHEDKNKIFSAINDSKNKCLTNFRVSFFI